MQSCHVLPKEFDELVQFQTITNYDKTLNKKKHKSIMSEINYSIDL